ncbi:hypothetical protein CLU97_0119 [Chryseobacterium sp. 7]|nr:hypothetical protein CLU97_0119 [Chryseobacterium sp. 7]
MKQLLLCAFALIALFPCSREDEMSSTSTSYSILSRKNILSKQAQVKSK